MISEKVGFFSVTHLLWHETSVYNGHLRGPVTLTPIAKCLVMKMSLPVFTTKVCRGWNSNTSPSANALTDCVTAAASTVLRARILPKTTTASLSGIMVKVGLFGLLWHSRKSGRLNFLYMSWRSFYIIFINKITSLISKVKALLMTHALLSTCTCKYRHDSWIAFHFPYTEALSLLMKSFIILSLLWERRVIYHIIPVLIQFLIKQSISKDISLFRVHSQGIGVLGVLNILCI